MLSRQHKPGEPIIYLISWQKNWWGKTDDTTYSNIDTLVYEQFGLTDEEIRLEEGSSGQALCNQVLVALKPAPPR